MCIVGTGLGGSLAKCRLIFWKIKCFYLSIFHAKKPCDRASIFHTQSVFTCSKLTLEILEQEVKYVQS